MMSPKKWSVSVKAAVIGGLLAIVAAFLTVAVPPLIDLIKKSPSLSIGNVASSLVNGRAAINILMTNASAKAQPLSSLKLNLWQSSPPLLMIGSSTYVFMAEIQVTSRQLGTIGGTATREKAANESHSVTFPLTGSLSIADAGGWSLTIALPIREEIPAEASLSLILVLPDSLSIVGTRSDAINPDFLTRPGVLNMGKFLARVGSMGISLEVSYADKETWGYKESISFREILSGVK